MNRTRNYRRKKHFAKINRAVKIIKSWGYTYKNIEQNAHRIAENMQICSCEGCGNPRHSNWLSNKKKLTIQERKHL